MSLEQYKFSQKLRNTIYGQLYKALDQKNGKFVALKLSNLSEGLRCGEDPMVEAFLMEKLILREEEEAPGSASVIRILSQYKASHEGTEYHCNVMEFADGGDMLEKIISLVKARRQMSLSTARRYFRMMAMGLAFIHSRNISHLDISLENILLTSKDEVKICDFGQAAEKRHFEASNHRKGKGKYMSPEIYARTEAYDGFKADVWSLGVCFWALLTGSLLYDRPSVSDRRFQYVMNGREGLEALLTLDRVHDVPSSALDLLSKMIEMNPIQRFTMEEVLKHPWLNPPPTTSLPGLKELELPSVSPTRSCSSSPSTTVYPSPSSTVSPSPSPRLRIRPALRCDTSSTTSCSPNSLRIPTTHPHSSSSSSLSSLSDDEQSLSLTIPEQSIKKTSTGNSMGGESCFFPHPLRSLPGSFDLKSEYNGSSGGSGCCNGIEDLSSTCIGTFLPSLKEVEESGHSPTVPSQSECKDSDDVGEDSQEKEEKEDSQEETTVYPMICPTPIVYSRTCDVHPLTKHSRNLVRAFTDTVLLGYTTV